jgi:LuxR family transcriptional regulator, maltose regulon positive regulatory protein
MTKHGVAETTGLPGADRHPLSPVSTLVDRPRLIRRLQGAATPVVLLNAPSGYGKSVLLSQWAEQDPRRFESIILGDVHNDPVMLVTSIVDALERVEPVPAEVTEALTGPTPAIEDVVLPRLGRALAKRQTPFALVLDDFELIESPQSLQVVSTIGGQLVRGSQLALATRTEPALPIGRLRAHRGLSELGRADLVMTKTECKTLLAELGLQPGPEHLDILVRRTEGWPAALYLAGLALGQEADLGKAITEFAGDDRIVVDYIREEFLGQVSQRRLEFLRRVSVLDRLSGNLCDAVLGRTGSSTVLRDLSRSNMLLMPLDRRDEWFRFHPLLREMLRSELHRVEPGEEIELNRRASAWWAEHGDWDRAIRDAIEGEAVERAGELIWVAYPEYASRGRQASITRWLERLGEENVASDPALSQTKAWVNVTNGLGAQAEHWAAVSRNLLDREAASPKKLAMTAGLGLVEAALGRDGAEAMSAHAATAAELLPDESPWLSMCCLFEGVGLHLRGLRKEAQDRLAEGARRGAVGAPNMQVLCLAQLSLLAIEEDDWRLAEKLTYQARGQIERSGLGEYPTMALGLAVSALVSAHAGNVDRAAADRKLATHLLGTLDELAPWYEAETRIALARTAARLDDAPTATALLDEASRLLKLIPDATVLGEWIDRATAAAETVSGSAVKDLTRAELRVLRFLPTHFSFPQIAERLFVSPNTVKTQAQGLYRKLGVSSRGEAVEHARAAGLLDDDTQPDASNS